jgi:hypothetical protein
MSINGLSDIKSMNGFLIKDMLPEQLNYSCADAGWVENDYFGQTFTTLIDFDLYSVTIGIGSNDNTNSITLEIRTTTGEDNHPADTVLATVTIPGGTIPTSGLNKINFIDFNLSSPLSLTAGQVYAIVWTAGNIHYTSFYQYQIGWNDSDFTDPYIGGYAWDLASGSASDWEKYFEGEHQTSDFYFKLNQSSS